MTTKTSKTHPVDVEIPAIDIPLLPEAYVINPLQLRRLTSAIAAKLEELLPSLTKIGWKMEFHGLDHEDTIQEMAVALMEKAAVNPDFTSQQDAYILQYAKWCAWHLINAAKTYGDYVQPETWTEDSDTGDQVSSLDYIPCDASLDDTIEQHEAAIKLAEVIQTLSPDNQKVIKMLYIGYSRAEIAEKLNISRPAVTQRITTIKKAMRPVCKEFGIAQYQMVSAGI